jgi:hypothetical protein
MLRLPEEEVSGGGVAVEAKDAAVGPVAASATGSSSSSTISLSRSMDKIMAK